VAVCPGTVAAPLHVSKHAMSHFRHYTASHL
jgi:hypothetical protein